MYLLVLLTVHRMQLASIICVFKAYTLLMAVSTGVITILTQKKHISYTCSTDKSLRMPVMLGFFKQETPMQHAKKLMGALHKQSAWQCFASSFYFTAALVFNTTRSRTDTLGCKLATMPTTPFLCDYHYIRSREMKYWQGEPSRDRMHCHAFNNLVYAVHPWSIWHLSVLHTICHYIHHTVYNYCVFFCTCVHAILFLIIQKVIRTNKWGVNKTYTCIPGHKHYIVCSVLHCTLNFQSIVP